MYMHHPADRITHTTAFVTQVVEHCLKREIVQWEIIVFICICLTKRSKVNHTCVCVCVCVRYLCYYLFLIRVGGCGGVCSQDAKAVHTKDQYCSVYTGIMFKQA